MNKYDFAYEILCIPFPTEYLECVSTWRNSKTIEATQQIGYEAGKRYAIAHRTPYNQIMKLGPLAYMEALSSSGKSPKEIALDHAYDFSDEMPREETYMEYSERPHVQAFIEGWLKGFNGTA